MLQEGQLTLLFTFYQLDDIMKSSYHLRSLKMKKILIAALLAAITVTSSIAEAQPRHHGGGGGGRWFGPAIVGGLIGLSIYEASRPQYPQYYPQYYQQPQPVYIAPPVEVQSQPIYDRVYDYSPGCNCYTYVWKQVGWK